MAKPAPSAIITLLCKAPLQDKLCAKWFVSRVGEAIISSLDGDVKNGQPGKPPAKRRWRFLVFTGAALGFGVAILFSGAFASFVQYTNTLEFCISCHEMRSTVYQEFKKSTHFSSRSGVHPVCADCHVPHGNWIEIVVHKIGATKELLGHLRGTIDTREKFEAKRLELAKSVWARMKANDSAECRLCHMVANWDLSLHKPRARAQHQEMAKNGETCIDCHKGIAHKEPEDPSKEEKEEGDEEPSFDLE